MAELQERTLHTLMLIMQVALLVILAQVGCFVPAEFMSLHPFESLFTRMGTGDSIETNSSSFMVEMQDTAHIVSHATSKCACPAALAAWCGTV